MSNQLQEELKQNKPFLSLEHEALLSIFRTAGKPEHGMSEALKPFEITLTQYNVLRILRGAGEGGLCRNEVRDRLVAQVPDATRLLDRMEQMGLLTRERSRDDRRFVMTLITEKGLQLLARLDGPIYDAHQEQLGHLDEAELRSLIELLAKVRLTG